MVLTDQSFVTAQAAVAAAQGEAAGDLILYFNSTFNVASLLYVDGTDQAHSIARLTDIDTLTEFQNTTFTANNFYFI
jgi:hypothetical protein